MKYIDAEKLKSEIERRMKFHDDAMKVCVGLTNIALTHGAGWKEDNELLSFIDSLQQEQVDMGEVSDGYHTFNELYYYRMLYNAAFFNLLPKGMAHKSKRHHDGEECFGGGWFIVMANLPTGQISNHYELKYWDLFQIPEKEFADEWDGHSPQEAADRLYKYLQREQPDFPTTDEQVKEFLAAHPKIEVPEKYKNPDWLFKKQEQPEVDLEKEMDKLYGMYRDTNVDYYDETGEQLCFMKTLKDAFKDGAKWQYQKDRSEFAKLKAKEWCDGYDDAISQFVKISYEPRDWFSIGDGDFICGVSFNEAIPAGAELYYKKED